MREEIGPKNESKMVTNSVKNDVTNSTKNDVKTPHVFLELLDLLIVPEPRNHGGDRGDQIKVGHA